MPEVKRLNYFNQQFLTEKDFQDEQSYLVGMRRRHNRELHTWGVAEGLSVEQQGSSRIVVRPGSAIDRQGREVILTAPQDRDVAGFGRNTRVFVSVHYVEQMSEDDRQTGGTREDFTRVTEVAEVVVRKQEPDEEDLIPLAVVLIDGGGQIEKVDPSIRRAAGPYVPPGGIRTEHLADGCITPQKLSRDMDLVSGWVRQCFKPHPVSSSGKAAYDLGPTEAISGKEWAIGSMGIVSPPGAKRVLEFTVAGSKSGNGVTAVLYRCGWDAENSRHEAKPLITIKQAGEGAKPFCATRAAEKANERDTAGDLDTHFSALAVSIESSEAHVSLVAVRFQYLLEEATTR